MAAVGVGIGYIVLNGLVAIYYNVIIAKALYYIFGSFTSELPWANCGHDWNTDECSDTSQRSSSEKSHIGYGPHHQTAY